MVLDLIEVIEKDRKPACSQIDGRRTIEMTSRIYRSQIERKPVTLPQANRSWPLDLLPG
jgi:hypothetical protein